MLKAMGREPGKRVDWNAPGHAHELTLSCYRRLKLLGKDETKRLFLSELDKARKKLQYEVWAYVIMPEHVHLLVWPRLREYRIQDFRKTLKERSGKAVLNWIREYHPSAMARLVQPEGARLRTRFWQDGKGYDRNFWTPPLIWQCIRYIHGNPVRRNLCETPAGWPWSSYGSYEGTSSGEFEVDPCRVEDPEPSRGI